MPFFCHFSKLLFITAFVLASASAESHPQFSVHPTTRIVRPIINADTTLLAHTSSMTILRAVDQGRLDPGTHFNRLMLVLKSSEEQEFALRRLLDEQQDKGTAKYHQWLTPDTFGANFGVERSDLAKITTWLQDAGLTVDSVAKGARILTFSGTSGQIEAAFHTEMHRYALNGQMQVANSVDISIPTALVSVVAGVSSLNNFDPNPAPFKGRRMLLDRGGKVYPMVAENAAPDYTVPVSGNHFLGAGDLATILDTKALLAAGIDGTGQKIGVIGQADILMSDVQIYRTLFNLPKNDPTFTQIGEDSGTIADVDESSLNVELAGAVATMASVNYVTSGSSYFDQGIDDSAIYLVENNDVDIISLTYSGCEADLGAGGNAFYNTLWEQAAAQGQTVFVSSGDAGAAGCDSPGSAYASMGYGVNGMGSTPFNVSVGGTMFDEGQATGTTPYWGSAAAAPYSTALSYIPEVPWNEGNGGTHAESGLYGAGGGISLYYQTPGYQAGPGVPATDPIVFAAAVVPGPHRYIPDLALMAGVGHDATIFCSAGSCQLDSTGALTAAGLMGGTAEATSIMASAQALINQKNGGRQGLANYYYYRIAAAQSQTSCISSSLPSTAGAGCAFRDISAGNTNVPTNAASTTAIGFTAVPGYDLATGLGSVDVNNLANSWNAVNFNATKTSLTLAPTTGITHGAKQDFTIEVAPLSGAGTPSGDVSFIANAAFGGVGFSTLANGSAAGELSGLPAGTYTVYAHYAGDGTYGGSNSPGVSVTIAPEASTLMVSPYLLATNGAFSAATTFSYGSNVYLDAAVAGASQTGTPTGEITFTLNGGKSNSPSIVAPLDSTAKAYFDAGLGFAPLSIAPTAQVLSPGTYAVNAAYSGDTSFNASTLKPFNLVVVPANQPLSLRAVTAEVTSGSAATFNASIRTLSDSAGGVPATGTVTFNEGPNTLGTGSLVDGAVVFTSTALVAAGQHGITATYAGDGNYAPAASDAVNVTVGGSPSTLTLSASATSIQVGTTVLLTATAPAGSTGTVFFYDNGASLGGANIASTATGAIAVTTFRAGLHNITATFSGNSTTAGSTSSPTVITVAQNTPSLQLTSPQTIAAGSKVSMNAILLPSPAGKMPSNSAPSGTIQFLDGTALMGTVQVAYFSGKHPNYVGAFTTPALVPGTHTFTASYVGDVNYAAAVSNVQTNSIGLTTTTVSSSTANVGTGIPFALSAEVAPIVATSTAVGGTVMFIDGATALGTAPVAGGVAFLPNVTLAAVGSHSVTAVYSGDANYFTSTAGAGVNIVAETPAAVLSLSTKTLTIVRGQSGQAQLTLTTVGNYSGTATLGCSGLPALSACTFKTPTVTFNGADGSQMTALILSTTGPPGVSGATSFGFFWLPALSLGGLATLRRRRLPGWYRGLILLAIMALGSNMLIGCGGDVAPATPTGTYTVTITATTVGTTAASPSGKATTTLVVTIQ